MDGEANNERRGWGLPASAVVHALIAALLVFGLPSLPQPPREDVVSVTLEPPPEKPPEPARAAPPPPPPPAGPAKEPPPPAREQAAAAPVPTFNPVVKFGEKDAGPRQSLVGTGAEDKPDPPTPAVPDEPKAAEKATPETPDRDEKPPAVETETAEAEAQAKVKADEGTGSATDKLVATAAAALDKVAPPAPPRPTVQAKAAPEPKLQEARTLFSRSSTGGPAATTAMANIPRGIRAGRLCVTELRLQLLNAAYFPDLLPSYELKDGTVLKVRRSAFRAGGAWRNLSFECQVDADATSVRSFAFHVGDPLSREETLRRGLPMQ